MLRWRSPDLEQVTSSLEKKAANTASLANRKKALREALFVVSTQEMLLLVIHSASIYRRLALGQAPARRLGI